MENTRKTKRGYSSLQMIGKREIGQQYLLQDTLTSKYYEHVKMTWNLAQSGSEEHGGIFNLEFSPNGKMVVAACEKCTILMLDPTSRKCVNKLPNAHDDSVNCICFCDERIFASGSDDCAIALWDTRMLREHVMRLSGHTGWVKSLAYDKNTKLLLSSAFDGTVRTWDINSFSCSENISSTTILGEKYVSRMKLSPAGDKLILSSSQGKGGDEITIFHNLDLQNFVSDLRSLPERPVEHIQDNVLIRNALEKLNVISEYPDIPWCIPSFQVHPHGWCLVSRYFTRNHVQYTAVHDLQAIQGSSLAKNKRKLSHYVEESDSGRGFIKEQSFSPDGRVIASPFAHGARLLAFGSGCCDWCKSRQTGSAANRLTEVKCLLSHSMPVCCSIFSPVHMLVATGCLGGKIAFHEPKL